MDNLTHTQRGKIHTELEKMFNVNMHQFALIEELMLDGWQDNLYQKILQNEDIIDEIETTFMEHFSITVVLYVPVATELRKMISAHEVVLLLEEIGDLLLSLTEELKKTDLTLPDHAEFIAVLQEIFHILKNLLNNVAFSFFKEDKALIYQIIKKGADIERLARELPANLTAVFQEIPLTGQELQNIMSFNSIVFIMEKIKNITISIAKSTIFASEGTDMRHQRFEK